MKESDFVAHVSHSLSAACQSRRGRKFLNRFVRPAPDWAASNNAAGYYAQSERLLREGEVRMAALIRTRPEQREPGRGDDDCLIVYSLDENVDADALEALASRLRGLEGKESPDSNLQVISNSLNPNTAWIIGVPVPQSMDPPARCLVSCTMGLRACMPKRFFSGKSFPVATLPDEPGLAMMIPCDYWPAELYRRWGANAPGTTLGVGSLLGILLAGTFYLAAGAFASSTINTMIRSGTSEVELNGKFWFMTGLNVVLVICLALLIKKSSSMPSLKMADLVNRPWYDRLTSLPITRRSAFGVWCLAYVGGLILGFF
jgi:hypothetical protein